MSRAFLAALLTVVMVIAASPAGIPGPGETAFRPATSGRPELLPPSLAAARPLPPPVSWTSPPVDRASALAEDAGREAAGLPPRFALAETVSLTPENSGEWHELSEGLLLWRLRIVSAGALSLNFGFPRFRLPEGAALHVHAPGPPGSAPGGPARRFTAADNEAHGQLWTPVVLGPEAILELAVPAGLRSRVELELGAINAGYRGFGEPDGGETVLQLVEDCYLDVACPEADPWRAGVRAVAAISVRGTTLCTGFMINNTARDRRPLFMTAAHCGLAPSAAPSLVAYWGFESPTCGTGAPGPRHMAQTGANWLAAWSETDFTIVELDDDPDPAWGVAFAGWSRGPAPTSSACVHHPLGTEKRISFDRDPARVTSYSQTVSPGDGTHLRVADWDVGSTASGSSGSPLFDQNRRVVGQLRGGQAACGNDLADWFGRLATSWSGGGTPASRLQDWLDPLGTSPMAIETLDPLAALAVVPETDLASSGPLGGPFTPAAATLRVTNLTAAPLAVQVTVDVDWVAVGNGELALAPGATGTVEATLAPGARLLPAGVHVATIRLAAPGESEVRRRLRLTVGGQTALVRILPNPFRPALGPLRLSLELRAAGPVRLRVHDLRGRVVRTLLDGPAPAGSSTREWDGRDERGRLAAAGAYVLWFEAAGVVQQRKVILLP